MMRNAVVGVEGVCLLKSLDHAINTRRAIDRKWFGSAADPALYDDLAQFGDVVGMKMRQQ